MLLPRPLPITAPGPSGAMMLRSVARIRRDPLAFLAEVRAEHGGVAQFPIPRPATYLVSDPDAVRRVLVTNARAYGKRTMQYTTLALVTGEGLLAADTETWRRHRPVVQPAFHHEAVARVAEHVGTAADRLDREWTGPVAAGQVVDVEDALLRLGLDVVGRVLFGTDLGADARRLAAATVQALDVVVGRVRMPIAAPSWVPTPGNLRLAAALRRLDTAVTAMLAERQRRPLPDGSPPRDLLDLLTAGALGPPEIRDEIVTFIVAGHETVAAALTWAWYLLARNPDAAARLRAEVDAVLAERDTPLTYADLARLPYTRAVLDETLRLYPPAWLLTRRAREADVLAGVQVPADALVIISPWVVHRDPGCWTEPTAFRPDRFLAAGGRPTRPADVATGYLPFGAGPRQCIGRDMALVEATLGLAALARRYEPATGELPSVAATPMVTIRPVRGLRMRLRRRS